MTNFIRSPCDSIVNDVKANPVIEKRCEKWVLVATILGSSMAFLDSTIVNVTLPAIQDALHTSINQMQWVIEAYALMLGALLLIGGALGDLYGRRKVFLYGVVIFAVASAACGIAANIFSLIISRAIQGVGAALLVPGSLALISASFPEERRGQAIGTWAGFTAIMTAAGPVAGGWLVQHFSWRWVFFLNLPLALCVFIVTLFFVSESKNEHVCKKLDVVGALMVTLGLGALVFGLIEWGKQGSFLALLLGFIALIIFIVIETQVITPILPLTLFRSRNFSAANLITFFLYFALYGALFFLPLNLIQVQGYTATQAGASLLPLILLMFLLSRWAGGLVKHYGPKLPLIIGPAVAALGFLLLLRSANITSYWLSLFPGTFILGFGMAISVAPLTTVVMNSISVDYVGVASGVNNAIARIAGLLAIALFGLIMTHIFNHELVKQLHASALPMTTQQEIINQESSLADIKTNDMTANKIIHESFISGYEVILVLAAFLALASSFVASGMMVESELDSFI